MQKVAYVIVAVMLASGFAPHPLSEMAHRYNYDLDKIEERQPAYQQDKWDGMFKDRDSEIRELLLRNNCEWLGIQDDENDEPYLLMFNDMITASTLMVEVGVSNSDIVKHIVKSRLAWGIDPYEQYRRSA